MIKSFLSGILFIIFTLTTFDASAQLKGKNQFSAAIGIDFFSLDYCRYIGESNRHAIQLGFVVNQQRYYNQVFAPGPIQNQAEILYKLTALRIESFDFNVGIGYRTGDGIIYPSIPVLLEAQYWLPDDRASIIISSTTLLHGEDPIMQFLPSIGFGYRF